MDHCMSMGGECRKCGYPLQPSSKDVLFSGDGVWYCENCGFSIHLIFDNGLNKSTSKTIVNSEKKVPIPHGKTMNKLSRRPATGEEKEIGPGSAQVVHASQSYRAGCELCENTGPHTGPHGYFVEGEFYLFKNDVDDDL